jgi:sugar transferase (PEP-CTERM system associated)
VIRLFQVYFPARTIVLVTGEYLLVVGSFLLAVLLRLGPDASLALVYEHGLYKIVATGFVLILAAHYFDLYSPQNITSASEAYFRLLTTLGLLSFLIATATYFYPRYEIAQNVYLWGLVLTTASLLAWRSAYTAIIRVPWLREHIYVIGSRIKTNVVARNIIERPDLGLDVAGVIAVDDCDSEQFTEKISSLLSNRRIGRVVLAFSDRRGAMPVRELLTLRLHGIKVEEASGLLEKISGKMQIEDLRPSSLLFSEGFRLNTTFLLFRRLLSRTAALVLLLICLPMIPFIMLAIKLDSRGPVFYKQRRVGRRGRTFNVVKFRTMRTDAESTSGPKWAQKNDPRVTGVGKFLRKSRIDEIPQLWNVLRNDMGFIGPRPERPEFVEMLEKEIPYYQLRHIIAPGVTGWAQIKYPYGSTLEDAKEKLQYDLYYIKHMSYALDLFIMFQTIKTVLLRRGAQ